MLDYLLDVNFYIKLKGRTLFLELSSYALPLQLAQIRQPHGTREDSLIAASFPT